MMRFLLALTAFVMMLPAARAQELPGAEEVMTFSTEEIMALIDDAGWKARPFTEEDGLTGVGVTIGSRELVLIPTACVQGGACKGLYIYALLPDNPGAADLNTFNLNFNPARATAQGGMLVLDDYIVGDYGVVRGSLAVRMLVQADLIGAWWEFRSGDKAVDFSNTVSFDPIAGPSLGARTLRPEVRPFDMPETDRFRMLQANGSLINLRD
ncbi:MAG: hypothetical protein AAGA69_08710 [Pseudomonadota bacterium]